MALFKRRRIRFHTRTLEAVHHTCGAPFPRQTLDLLLLEGSGRPGRYTIRLLLSYLSLRVDCFGSLRQTELLVPTPREQCPLYQSIRKADDMDSRHKHFWAGPEDRGSETIVRSPTVPFSFQGAANDA